MSSFIDISRKSHVTAVEIVDTKSVREKIHPSIRGEKRDSSQREKKVRRCKIVSVIDVGRPDTPRKERGRRRDETFVLTMQ